MHISAVSSNIRYKIVLVQNGITDDGEDLAENATQTSSISNFFSLILDIIDLHTNIKKLTIKIKSISLSCIISTLTEKEHPTRIVVKMDANGSECNIISGK